MRVTITPSPLRGEIRAIPSKSQAHRLLICAALADRPTRLYCPALSQDIEATASCLRALGAEISHDGAAFDVLPIKSPQPGAVLDCGESGSTLRFLLPVACALGAGARMLMRGRLPQRPLSPLWEELERNGAALSRPDEKTVLAGGRLAAGDYRVAADVSSQFISGLLFALPLLSGDSRLKLTGSIESAGYIDMTVRALRAFGADIPFENDAFVISGGGRFCSQGEMTVEGDWSNAAFWLAANALCGGISCTGLDSASAQGDREALSAIGSIRRGGAVIDARDIPDLVPVLSVVAALSPGETSFVNAARLRIKESDRIRSTCAMLGALGAEAFETADGLRVVGKSRLSGGTVDSAGDHRIAMSAAVAAIACEGSVKICGAECVKKSYPAFWEDYACLGGKIRQEE